MKFEIIKGNLIDKALSGEFDVIGHGCNCFCTQKAGIALAMASTFRTDDTDWYPLEGSSYKGIFNKLGRIQYYYNRTLDLAVVNCYTQYEYGKGLQLDYEALTLCMRKINHEFKGNDIGLPWIGCGLAGGDKIKVEQILRQELKDCNVTICEL
jgi:O-acetyl-ADP-ribose deacetylase (regulator of RNase III)